MKIPALETEFDKLKDLFPTEQIKGYYPHKIVPPTGFYNPKYYSLCLANVDNWPQITPNDTDEVIRTVARNLIRYKLPTYFVDPQFTLDCAATIPPKDLTFGDVYLPLPSFLLVFPVEFIKSYVKWTCPFVGVTLVKAGEVVNSRSQNVIVKTDTILFHIPLLLESGRTLSYAAWYPLTQSIDCLISPEVEAHFEDVTKMQEDIMRVLNPERAALIDNDTSPQPPSEDEPALVSKIVLSSILVLMVFGTRPTFLESQKLTRKEKLYESGKVKTEALWSPNIIGHGYKIASEHAELGGSHASPTVHWRRKHLHTVRFGKEKSEKRLQWYAHTLVGLKNKDEG